MLPVTVVAGFLGAGKTTLVNHLLRHPGGRRLAVLVNDFGTIDVDAGLLRARGADVISLANGCICCSRRGELVDQVERLVGANDGRIDHLLVETSGVADPNDVVRALGYPQLRCRVGLAGVVTLLDPCCEPPAGAAGHLFAEQAAAADLLLLSRADVALPGQQHVAMRRWAVPGQEVLEVAHGAVAAGMVLRQRRGAGGRRPQPSSAAHTDAFSTWRWCPGATVDPPALEACLAGLPAAVLRAKGHLPRVGGGSIEVQVVGRAVSVALSDSLPETPGLVLVGLAGCPWAVVEDSLRAAVP